MNYAAAVDQARFVERVIEGQGLAVGELLRQRHADAAVNDQHAANRSLIEHVDRYGGTLPDNADDAQLRAHADGWASRVSKAIAARPLNYVDDPMAEYAIAHRACVDAGIEPARPDEVSDVNELRGCIARMRCPLWWRRRIRVSFGRRVEQGARAAGAVCAAKSAYISRDGLDRWRERQGENARTMANAVAVADDGTEMSLDEVAATTVSNPALRRAELMTRIRGCEEVAIERGDVGLFLTLTVPPSMHAVHSRTGEAGGGQHVTPREGNAWLSKQWQKARAKYGRRGITPYGMRVVEPHHDGTPHWHAMIFVNADQADELTAIIRAYVVNGATSKARLKHACRVVRIDPARGTAAGYIAKYVAKAVDGANILDATTTDAQGDEIVLGDAADNAERVRAWASQWGIRQFQPIGQPPVTVWRELRRLDAIEAGGAAERLRLAADTGDWRGYMNQMGGPGVKAAERPAHLLTIEREGERGRYGDRVYRFALGLFGRVYETRPIRWVIEYRPVRGDNGQEAARSMIDATNTQRHAAGERGPLGLDVSHLSSVGAAGAPWTRGNNCTGDVDDGGTNGRKTRVGLDPGRSRKAVGLADASRDESAGSDFQIDRGAGRSEHAH